MTSRQDEPRRGYRYFTLVTAIFVTCLITANIIAVKPVMIGPLLFPAAVAIFPISYIFEDILTEVYGYARSRQVIWIGFGCNLLAVVAISAGGWLPAAPFWANNQTAYASILGGTPGVLAASFVAYLVGEFLNSFVLAKMKVATQGRWLWMRTIGSTLVGQLADSAVLTQWLLKSGYETLVTPLTYAAVTFLKRAEQEDYYDYQTDFNPLKVDVGN